MTHSTQIVKVKLDGLHQRSDDDKHLADVRRMAHKAHISDLKQFDWDILDADTARRIHDLLPWRLVKDEETYRVVVSKPVRP